MEEGFAQPGGQGHTPWRGVMGDRPACPPLPPRPPKMARRSLAGTLGLGLASEDKSEPSVW